MSELRIELDTAEARAAIDRVRATAESLPLDARQRFADECLRLLDGNFLKIAELGSASATDAGDRVVRLGIFGFDELIAAALGAVGRDLRHNRPPV